MNILEICLILPVAGIAYFYLRIKGALRSKGFRADKVLSLGSDYYNFKTLIKSETDEEERKKYNTILFGLHISFALLAFAVFIGMILI
jgi:hypothetical protein